MLSVASIKIDENGKEIQLNKKISIEDAIKICNDIYDEDSSPLPYELIISETDRYLTQDESMALVSLFERCDKIKEISSKIKIFKTENVIKLISLMSNIQREKVGKAIQLGCLKDAIEFIEEKNVD